MTSTTRRARGSQNGYGGTHMRPGSGRPKSRPNHERADSRRKPAGFVTRSAAQRAVSPGRALVARDQHVEACKDARRQVEGQRRTRATGGPSRGRQASFGPAECRRPEAQKAPRQRRLALNAEKGHKPGGKKARLVQEGIRRAGRKRASEEVEQEASTGSQARRSTREEGAKEKSARRNEKVGREGGREEGEGAKQARG